MIVATCIEANSLDDLARYSAADGGTARRRALHENGTKRAPEFFYRLT